MQISIEWFRLFCIQFELKMRKFLYLLLLPLCLAVGACGSDDEESDGEKVVTPNGRIIVDGKEYKVNYGYWEYDDTHSQTKYFLEFTETSIESGFQTGSGNYIQIQFYANAGGTLPTGEFKPTYVEVITKSEAYEIKFGSNVVLKIEKMGETYTFTLIGKAAVHGSSDYSKDLTFTFKDKMTYRDDEDD